MWEAEIARADDFERNSDSFFVNWVDHIKLEEKLRFWIKGNITSQQSWYIVWCLMKYTFHMVRDNQDKAGSKRTGILWAGISGLAEILGGVLAWLILGSMISPVVMAAIMAAVAGIMVALSVDELMPLAKEIDPNNNPSYGVLCGMSVMGFSLVLLQTSGIG